MRSVNAIKASVLEFQRLQSFNENDEMMFFLSDGVFTEAVLSWGVLTPSQFGFNIQDRLHNAVLARQTDSPRESALCTAVFSTSHQNGMHACNTTPKSLYDVTAWPSDA